MSASQSSHLKSKQRFDMFSPFLLLWMDAESGLDAFSFSWKTKIVDGYIQQGAIIVYLYYYQ